MTKKRNAPNSGSTPNTFDSQFKGTQYSRYYQYLQKYTATTAMAAIALDIPDKNLTRYKRELEKKGLLHSYPNKMACKNTGFKAHYLTTNKDLIAKEVKNG